MERDTPAAEVNISSSSSGSHVSVSDAGSSKKRSSSSRSSAKNRYRDAFVSVKDFSSSISVQDWIRYFKLATEGLEEDEKIRLFRAKLETECYGWYATLDSDGKKRSIDQWIEELREEFTLTPQQMRQAIQDRKQKEGEEARRFIREIITLCKRYNPSMHESEQLQYITDNVHPRYRDLYIRFSAHDETAKDAEISLQTAMRESGREAAIPVNLVADQGRSSAAAAGEITGAATGAANNPWDSRDAFLAFTTQYSRRGVPFTPRGRGNGMRGSFRQHPYDARRQTGSWGAGAGNRRSEAEQQQRTPRARECYGCGDTDHLVRDCPLRPSTRGRENSNPNTMPLGSRNHQGTRSTGSQGNVIPRRS